MFIIINKPAAKKYLKPGVFFLPNNTQQQEIFRRRNIKAKILITFLLLLFFQSGCKQATEPKASDIYVNFEIESDFHDDSVKVALDDKILLESRVTTDYTIQADFRGCQELVTPCISQSLRRFCNFLGDE